MHCSKTFSDYHVIYLALIRGHTMKHLLLGLFFISLLSGCTPTSKPIPDGYKGSLVTVHDSLKSRGPQQAYFFELSKVDGRSVTTSSSATYDANYGNGLSMTPVVEKRKIPAKKSTLSIQGVTHFAAPILALGGGNYHVQGDVIVNLKPGNTYYIKGKLSKTYKAVWVENSQGKIVSKKIALGNPSTQKVIKKFAKGSAGTGIVTVYNAAGFMHADGSAPVSLQIDDIDYGVLGSKQYAQIVLPKGKHTFKLSHRDMITFRSQHVVDVNAPNITIEIAPTIVSNRLALKKSLPSGFKKISLDN